MMTSPSKEAIEKKLDHVEMRLRILVNDDTIHDTSSPYWTDLRETRKEYYELCELLKNET